MAQMPISAYDALTAQLGHIGQLAAPAFRSGLAASESRVRQAASFGGTAR
jgi:hypothetical protein